ncbi:RsmB/NOP family class I SAM-dependent RNA methyltransferase [Magnetospirillum sp. UT-4]|uniref:RsmB/NOP family class I SAM-dependent RNA methyltransferase n=1 Tax=Magnetospirillum sp. UT-4 TaxID=2681467 RepID=UPI0013829010|nr:RsmB/NOP family class I SAM-dependent RNA methyltransferase [Magnetospirillum sp. UT-4]CAA7612905.1 Fmu (Sun)/eukaryotic nucleolar NOL1/Nop2p [Magnetospirillum sp. UT-4]
MTPAARLSAAIDLLDEIEGNARPADQVASFYFKGRRYIGAKDRRAVADIVWRVLRRKARIGWWLEHLDFPVESRARVLADLALSGQAAEPELFQGPHSAAPPGREEKRMMEALRGKDLFHRDMPAWVRGEFPEWLTPRLEALWGEAMVREVGAMRDEAPLDLRVNTLKATRDEAVAALRADKLDPRPTRWSPLGLRLAERAPMVQMQAWRNGLVEIQDEGSQLVALLAEARPGMAVCDYCAGAGGKTLALAATMENKGRLVACDVAEWRVDKAGERFRRAGVHNVSRRVIEGAADKWIKRSAASFDRVLVDAPCTGTGTWRRNPDAKWQLTEQTLAELMESQRVILASAARLVKPGGRLIYATCSVLAEENETQMQGFLAAHPEYTVRPVPDLWPALVGTECPVTGPYLRLSPLAHGTDGFFAAVLERAA